MDDVRVAQLWRYPVKSLRGEALSVARLTPDGVDGDRVVHVAGPRGPLTGRTRHGLLTIPAVTGPRRPRRWLTVTPGIPFVPGRSFRSHAGTEARLVADKTPERFDVLNLLVATDGAARTCSVTTSADCGPTSCSPECRRNWNPNFPGERSSIGDALIGVHSRATTMRRHLHRPGQRRRRISTCSAASATSSVANWH